MQTMTRTLTLLMTALLFACDASSSDTPTLDSSEVAQHDIKPDKQISTESITTLEIEPQQQWVNAPDWRPFITDTPAKQARKPFSLPKENISKLKEFFHENTNAIEIQDEGFFENEHIFNGDIKYSNGTSIMYTFNKKNNNYFNELFLMYGEYKPNESFSPADKDIIYKILEISGADNPEDFFQELINSPQITKYEGCTVQQKQSKYAMVDLTSCEFDNRTDLSLYNPKS
ncbi:MULTISPECIES: hypothetical protein [unclassified Psychrobacter]|uniref:hypothetical protein n=1 Tax=unclassified Psychrobacter TaxID=196806 RepID=UPI004037F481